MSGIYIHIPFCKTRCNYCDFYSKESNESHSFVVEAIIKEMELRKAYLSSNRIDTIYFGGGTPSLLKIEEFDAIFNAIYKTYNVSPQAEISLEANPDDLSPSYLSGLVSLPFNRMSIGIQSFDDEQLRLINRRHSSEQAVRAVKNAQEFGFDNISIDLIYGLPTQSLSSWEKQVEIALEQEVQHISAYALSYEEGTVLWYLRHKGKIKPVQDESVVAMYRSLIVSCKQRGYEQYEISSFALPERRSRHNSSYWKQKEYIGIGPSAHSYDGQSRQWNICSSSKYVAAIAENKPFWEREELSLFDRYNDFVMISLRTCEGLSISELEEKFGRELKEYFLRNIKKQIGNGTVIYSNDLVYLTVDGFLVSDMILAELMRV